MPVQLRYRRDFLGEVAGDQLAELLRYLQRPVRIASDSAHETAAELSTFKKPNVWATTSPGSSGLPLIGVRFGLRLLLPRSRFTPLSLMGRARTRWETWWRHRCPCTCGSSWRWRCHRVIFLYLRMDPPYLRMVKRRGLWFAW
jgi:hypothetical protein